VDNEEEKWVNAKSGDMPPLRKEKKRRREKGKNDFVM